MARLQCRQGFALSILGLARRRQKEVQMPLFQSFNFRDRFIRHSNSRASLSRMQEGGSRRLLPRWSAVVKAGWPCGRRIFPTTSCDTRTSGFFWGNRLVPGISSFSWTRHSSSSLDWRIRRASPSGRSTSRTGTCAIATSSCSSSRKTVRIFRRMRRSSGRSRLITGRSKTLWTSSRASRANDVSRDEQNRSKP